MKVVTRSARLAIVLVAVLALAGCYSYYLGEDAPRLTSKSVRGVWSHKGPDGAVATVSFSSDHTFTAMNIPQLAHPTPEQIKSGQHDTVSNWSATLTGQGTWTIRHEPDSDLTTVDLTYDDKSSPALSAESADSGWRNYATMWGLSVKGKVRLFFTIGDPDEKYRFVFDRPK